MNIKSINFLVPILCFVIFASIGWQMSHGVNTIEATPGSGLSHTSKNRSATYVNKNGASAEAKQQLANIFSKKDKKERWRAVMSLAKNIPTADIKKWLDNGWFGNREGYEYTLFYKIMIERWQNEEPSQYALWELKQNGYYSESSLANFAMKNPQLIPDLLSQDISNSAKSNLLAKFAEYDPQGAFTKMKELLDKGMVLGNYEQLFLTIARKNPALLESSVDSLPQYLRVNAKAALIETQLLANDSHSLAAIYNDPNNMQILSNLSYEAKRSDQFFSQMANMPESWKSRIADNFFPFLNFEKSKEYYFADYVKMGFTEEQARRMKEQALNSLASKEPSLALKEINSGNIDKNAKNDALRNLLYRVSSDSETAQKYINDLSSPEDRAYAKQFLDRVTQEDKQSNEPIDSATLVKKTLEKLNGKVDQNSPVVFVQMSNEERETFSASFANLDAKQKLAAFSNLSNVSYSNPSYQKLLSQSTDYVLSLPEESLNEYMSQKVSNAASQIAAYKAQADAVSAAKWVGAIKNPTAKIEAASSLYQSWQVYDKPAADQWLKSLPKENQNKVKERLNQ